MSLNLFDAAMDDPRRAMAADQLEHAQRTGFPVVASQFARRDRAGMAVGVSFALLLGAVTLFAMSGARSQEASAAAEATPDTAASSAPAPALPTTDVSLPAALPANAPPGALPLPIAVSAPSAGAISPADRARSVALIFDTSVPVTARPAAPLAAAPAAAKPPPQGLSADELFAQRFGSEGETASATRMTSPATTVAQGTLMTAILETAIDSDLPGFVRAVISVDVKSYDGSRVLIPRGSHVIGEYKSGLAVGQTRALVQWTRLMRPDGVSIALGSPATDFSGRTGLGGKVNSHFGKRYGAALLLSVIGAAGQAIGGGSGTVIVAGPQAAVSSVSQQNMAIPPTVRVALGQPIRIFTARDLDFAAVSAAP
jgi:type IV secretion system protein VirB10